MEKDILEENPFSDENLEDLVEDPEFGADVLFQLDQRFIFHCKPVFNFQSIEFDFEGTYDDIPDMMEVYAKVLQELSKVAIPQPGQKPDNNTEDLATAKQKQIMDMYHLPYNSKTTKKEAQRLITESMNK